MPKGKENKKRWLNLTAFVVGVGILAAFVTNLGWPETRDQLTMVGPGFFALVGTMLTALTLEVIAWRMAIGAKIPLSTLLGTAMAGTAINSLTPLGEGGEVIKVNLLSAHVPMTRSISSVLVWNICFRITKHLVIFLSILVMPLLAAEVLTNAQFGAFLLAALISFIPTVLFFLALSKGSAGLAVTFLQKVPAFRKWAPEKLREAAATIDDEVKSFGGTYRTKALTMCGLLVLARLFSALEIIMVMQFLGAEVGLVHGLFLYCSTMILRNFLSISPVQLGVAEGGESFLFKLLGFPLSVGFTQAFIRVLRLMLFNLVGLAFLGSKSFSKPTQTTEPAHGPITNASPTEEDESPVDSAS